MEFPQFRRYKNAQSYFKITSENTFIEYKLMGNKLEMYIIEAKILPDRNYIHDLLYNYDEYWEKLNEASFNSFLKSHNFPK